MGATSYGRATIFNVNSGTDGLDAVWAKVGLAVSRLDPIKKTMRSKDKLLLRSLIPNEG